MTLPREGKLLRIFVGENDKFERIPLFEWIVRKAREEGLAGPERREQRCDRGLERREEGGPWAACAVVGADGVVVEVHVDAHPVVVVLDADEPT